MTYLTKTAKELTQKYQNNELPAGHYYFCVGDITPDIGYYKPADTDPFILERRKKFGLPAPQPKIYNGTTTFVGVLKTVTILAPVLPYHYEEE